jgi:hypothetical protein
MKIFKREEEHRCVDYYDYYFLFLRPSLKDNGQFGKKTFD